MSIDLKIIIAQLSTGEFKILVTEKNALFTRECLKEENKKLINKLKEFKKAGLINSIKNPKNKGMQKYINEITKYKKINKKAIRKINEFYLHN